VELYLHSLPQYAFMAWCLVKAQGQLYLYNELIPIEGVLPRLEKTGFLRINFEV
jgi:hypothetical protein